jgi:hypothetical protein
MPDVVTHHYDPKVGACLNICGLTDDHALQVLNSLQRLRPTLNSGYLARRRSTELWLAQAASQVLTRRVDDAPAYFFLGDFSHALEQARPASLLVPLSTLPSDAITFTLGDSMSLRGLTERKVYTLAEMVNMFASHTVVEAFGLSNRDGFQERFIEVQLWDRSHQPFARLIKGATLSCRNAL